MIIPEREYKRVTLLLVNEYIKVSNSIQDKRYDVFLSPLKEEEIKILKENYTSCLVREDMLAKFYCNLVDTAEKAHFILNTNIIEKKEKVKGKIYFGVSKDVMSIIYRMRNNLSVSLRERRIAHFIIARNVAALYLRDYGAGVIMSAATTRFMKPELLLSVFEKSMKTLCTVGLKIPKIPDLPVGEQGIVDNVTDKVVETIKDNMLYGEFSKSVNLIKAKKGLEFGVQSLSMMKELRADVVAVTFINNYMYITGKENILDNKQAFEDIFSYYTDKRSILFDNLTIAFPKKIDRINYTRIFGFNQYNFSDKAQYKIITDCVKEYKITIPVLYKTLFYLYKNTTGVEQEWFKVWLEFMNKSRGKGRKVKI